MSGLADGAAVTGGGFPTGDLRTRLSRGMAARLGLAVAVFGLSLAFVGVGDEGAERAAYGLYGTVTFAFIATALYSAIFRFVRHTPRFAALQLATDVGIVSSLVFFTGGVDSIFSFLYLPVTVYGAILFDRWGAYGTAVLSSLGFGATHWLARTWGFPASDGIHPASEMVLLLWGAHTGALLLVALFASTLARELRITGERLDQRALDLERLQRLHQRTVESLTSGLLTTDPDGRVTTFNPEAEHITGRRSADVVGLDLDDVLPGVGEMVQRDGGRATVRRRLGFVKPGGEMRHLGLASSVLREDDGRPSGRVVIFQDVTEIVHMEGELERSARLAGIGQLAADIAHEIRNPLAAISGSVEVLRRRPGAEGAEPQTDRLMAIVIREIERLDALITDFLQYARPAPPKPQVLALDTVVGEVLEMFEGARPPGVDIALDIAPGCAVLADSTQLRQVLWNLARNAVEAMAEGGRITIRAAESAGEAQGGSGADRNDPKEGAPGVEILVADTGCGIAPDVLERVFDPFFTTKPSGTGLGLATVHRIVESNGGVLRVTSTPGEGTAFRIWLPAGTGTGTGTEPAAGGASGEAA